MLHWQRRVTPRNSSDPAIQDAASSERRHRSATAELSSWRRPFYCKCWQPTRSPSIPCCYEEQAWIKAAVSISLSRIYQTNQSDWNVSLASLPKLAYLAIGVAVEQARPLLLLRARSEGQHFIYGLSHQIRLKAQGLRRVHHSERPDGGGQSLLVLQAVGAPLSRRF